MQWTEESLAKLPVKSGYRLRGENMTRIEVFSDAAFAFAVTLLVISLSEIPQNLEQLLSAMYGVPSFAGSFAVMTLIWFSHRQWSERFGLDDGPSTFLTLTLIFVVLIYVYPLKLIMDLTFYGFSSKYFPTEFSIGSGYDVAILVALFGLGFTIVAAVQLGLYKRVSLKEGELCLNKLESLLVRKEQIMLMVQVSIGLLVTVLAVTLSSTIGYLAGIMFALTPVAIFFATSPIRKQIKALTIK